MFFMFWPGVGYNLIFLCFLGGEWGKTNFLMFSGGRVKNTGTHTIQTFDSHSSHRYDQSGLVSEQIDSAGVIGDKDLIESTGTR